MASLARAVNAPPNYVFAFSVYGLKTMLSPEIPNNDRSFRPICTHAPLGSILNPRYPAAVSARHVVAQLLPSTLMTALAKAVPERVQATPVSPSCSFHMSGEHRGRPTQW